MLLTAGQVYLLDGLDGLVSPLLFPTDTQYSSGYSDRGFRRIHEGQSTADVRALVGEPLEVVWDYANIDARCGFIRISADRVTSVVERPGCPIVPVTVGMSSAEVVSRRKRASSQVWIFSTSPTGKSYRERVVYIEGDIVQRKKAAFYTD